MPRHCALPWPECMGKRWLPAHQARPTSTYFRVLIHSTRNRVLGLLYRWGEHTFSGREHDLTGAYAPP